MCLCSLSKCSHSCDDWIYHLFLSGTTVNVSVRRCWMKYWHASSWVAFHMQEDWCLFLLGLFVSSCLYPALCLLLWSLFLLQMCFWCLSSFCHIKELSWVHSPAHFHQMFRNMRVLATNMTCIVITFISDRGKDLLYSVSISYNLFVKLTLCTFTMDGCLLMMKFNFVC